MSLINLSMRLDQFKHNQLFVIDRETSFILFIYQKSIQHLVLHLNLCPRGTTCHLILVNFKGVSRCLKLRQRFSRDEILNQEYRLDSFSISFHQFSVWDAVSVLLSCYQMFLGFFRERRAAASELK